MFGRTVKKPAVLSKQGVDILCLASPIHPLREVNEERVDPHPRLFKVLPEAQPNVLSQRKSVEGVDARSQRVRREGGQVPTPIRERIVLKINDRIAGFGQPTLAKFAVLFLFFGPVVHSTPGADNRTHHMRFQFFDAQRGKRVNVVGAVEHFPLRKGFTNLPRHTVHKIPDIIRGQPALVSLG